MFKTMKLQLKLVIIGCLLVVLPQTVVGFITFFQNKSTLNATIEETTRLAYADLDYKLKSLHSLIASHQDVIEKNVKSALNVAREIVSYSGGFSTDERTVIWDATNQFSLASSKHELPRMKMGNSWFGQVTDPNTPVPVVDRVQETISVTCTVFQRMNVSGDMLRVATNVTKKDGTRAIGTFIPSVNPDGKANPVIAAVMRGETFAGRAYVVNNWFIAAYEPIRDAANKIIGMLYVGIPIDSVKSLRQSIQEIQVGKTGYAWVLDSNGYYVISKDNKRDGEDISAAKDDDGNLFVMEMVNKAKALKPGEIGEQKYPWKNTGEPKARMKVSRFIYFAPWDWTIGVGTYTDEFMETAIRLEASARQSSITLLSVLICSLAASVLIWMVIAKRITQPIIKLTDAAERMSMGDLSMKIDTLSTDEIGTLARAIKRMQNSLRMAMERIQKQKQV
ncbi:MAG: Cache 3/Cache 2 fusion domain-containing protein [Desulfatirhabdiaceae bacterium]|nr:Cache 3/Cache 2 fusion domain-containing protein [Desulfatirhabdiaceae bacterium]